MKENIKIFLQDIFKIILLVSIIVLSIYYQKNIYPFGNETIAYGDMVQQTIPENLYYMWDVLHGKANAFFSWNSGFGINLSGVAAEQAYLSPLNLFIIFSARENLLNFTNILFLIKLICIAIAMYSYLRKYKVTSISKIGASILYAFGAASLIHYNIMFVMDMAFLLPLLMIGYDRIWKKKKCDLFIAVCTFCLIENIYMSFMVLLFVLLSSGVQIVCWNKEEENKGEYVFLLGISVAISVMLSAIIVLPAMLAIMNSSRVGKSFIDTYAEAINAAWSQRDWNLAKFMLMNLTFPIVLIIYGILMNKKYKNKQVILLFLLLIPIVVSGTELLWHGGSRAWWPIRFVFIISFVLIDFSIKFLQDEVIRIEPLNRVSVIVSVFWGLLCSKVLCDILSKLFDINAYKELIFLLIVGFCGGGYLWILCGKKKHSYFVIILLLFEISSISYLFITPGIYNTGEFSVGYLRDAQLINNQVEEALQPFERVKNSDGSISNVNYSLVMGRESLANYLHVINASYQPALRKWGYSTNWTRLLDTGGTIFSDTMFGIKYLISSSVLSSQLYDKVFELDGTMGFRYYIYRNKYEIPLVSYISEDFEELSNKDLYGNQNKIFRAVTDFSEDLITQYDNIKVNESTIIEVENKKIIYLHSEGNQNVTIKVNNEEVAIPSMQDVRNRNYPSNYNNLICLGCFEKQTVTIDFANVQNATGLHLGLLDVELFEKGIEKINNELRQNTKISRNNTGVKIELNSSREGYIFVPILFDEGWNCKVNGNRESIQDAFGFLKVHVQEGENLIYLQYIPQGRPIGLVITAIGIIICFTFFKLYTNRAHGNYMNYVYNTSCFLLMLLFVSILILFYVIPIIKYLEKLFIIQ